MAFMLAAKPVSRPARKQRKRRRAQLMTFAAGIHLLHHAKHRNVVGKRCHHAGCRDIVHIQHLTDAHQRFFQTSESTAVPLDTP